MVIIETSLFEQLRERYLPDDEYAVLGWYLSRWPEMGRVMPGSGGLRKLRWRSAGSGKRGGLRLTYYWITAADEILLLTVYNKREMNDLTKNEIRALRRLITH